MTLSIEFQATEPLPLTASKDGIVRVEGTRVPLEVVIDAFNAGQSAEEIVLGYPTLDLADLYAVLAYYLHHRGEVDSYVADRRREADALRARIESRFDSRAIREQLLARRSSAES
jgi:uncharacterized protein (DUF433 family)